MPPLAVELQAVLSEICRLTSNATAQQPAEQALITGLAAYDLMHHVQS